MKIKLLLILLAGFASTANAQYGIVGNGQPFYEPEMDSVFMEWERLVDTIAEGCKVLNPCSTNYDYEKVVIPFRIELRDESEVIELDERSIAVVLRDALSKNHKGYRAVPAKNHTGHVKDTLVLMLDLKDVSYRLGSNFRIGTDTYVGEVCKSSSWGSSAPIEGIEISVDSLWHSMEINEFSLGSMVYQQVEETALCYFEFKKWPTFREFEIDKRSSNPWYEYRNKR